MYKYTPTTRKRLTSKICALVGVFVLVLSLLIVPTSADNANTKNFTILYNPIVETTNSQNIYYFDLTANDYIYTDSVVYMVYSINTLSGIWSITSDNETYTLQWDDLAIGQGLRVATAYLDNITLTDSIILSQSFLVINPSPPQVLYLIIADEANEQDASYMASFLRDLDNDGYSLYTEYLLNTLEISDIASADKGFNQGVIIGQQNGYSDGYADGFYEGEDFGYSNGKQDGFDDGYEKGKKVGEKEGYDKGADGIGLERLPFAITDSIANMFTRILNFELLGVNVLALCGTLITLAIVAFVIKRLI